ncbi:HpsJ family protein [Cyanobium sp. FGCU-6]|jgi:hypothetical protein|nr:HpsJ family protein [Cyanobium sp. FGCU6]
MSSGNYYDDLSKATMASQLGLVGLSLLLLCSGTVLLSILPLQILNAAWQLQFINVLINTSGIGLIGLALVRLAAHVDPSSGRLRRRRDAFAAWACAAVIGFLLLIPLQGYAAWNRWVNASQARNQQLTTTERRVSELRKAITSATTTEQLQRNLKAFQVRPLPPAALSTPLPQLRQQLLDTLQRSEGLVKQRFDRIPPESVWALAQNSVRNVFSALVLSIAFAGLAQRPGVAFSFLHEFRALWRRRQKRSESQARQGGGGFLGQSKKSDRAYLRSLAQPEEPAADEKRRDD